MKTMSKHVFLTAVVMAIAMPIGLSSWFGWVTGGTAKKMAQNQTDNALVAYGAPLCFAQFKALPNAPAEANKVIKNQNDYNSDVSGAQIIEGLHLVPDATKGFNSTDREAIAEACANDVIALKTLDGVKLASGNTD
ncbi:MAG TPA: hypothetical protein VMV50_02610 [Candidatus Paceibacterota bacterium]|nr:hypothetical protein [Candidatus Paceibacterota bacterium]